MAKLRSEFSRSNVWGAHGVKVAGKRIAVKKSTVFSTRVISGLVALSDALIVIMAGMAMYLLYIGWAPESLKLYGLATVVNLLLTLGAFYISGLYNFDTIVAPYQQIIKIISICAGVFLALVLVAFALKVSASFSRVWSFSSFVCEASLICVVRAYSYHLIKKFAFAGLLIRRMVIVGAGDQGERLAKELNKQLEKHPWIRIVGIFDDRADRSPANISGIPLIGNLEELTHEVRNGRIDDIVVALPWAAEDRLLAILKKVTALPVNIYMSPDLIGLKFPQRGYRSVGGVNCLNISEKPISEWNYFLKRIEDIILSLLILVLILPLLVVIATAIKLDSRGPVVFRQKRYGFNNEVFDVYKFRSMYFNRPPEQGVPQAKRNDPRVTRVGKFLRATSLDELPQVFNVLQGVMSLVGPRPHAVAHNEQYAETITGYFARHRVKPGITGWAQVNGWRGETDSHVKLENRVRHDIEYIENWSLFLDLKILFMTAFIVFVQKSAY